MSINSNKILFVYFDVGGVLLIDYSETDKWSQMKRDLGITDELDKQFDNVWKNHRSRICIDCDVDTIIPEFEEKVGIKIPGDYSMLADFVNRFELNNSIHEIAQKIKEKYKVGLLTNMYPRMLSLIKEKKLIPKIDWDSEVDSSVIGLQKPESGIFERAEQMAEASPSQIFFVDNSLENVEAAQKRGWQALLYDPKDIAGSNAKLAHALDIKLD